MRYARIRFLLLSYVKRVAVFAKRYRAFAVALGSLVTSFLVLYGLSLWTPGPQGWMLFLIAAGFLVCATFLAWLWYVAARQEAARNRRRPPSRELWVMPAEKPDRDYSTISADAREAALRVAYPADGRTRYHSSDSWLPREDPGRVDEALERARSKQREEGD